ncbi:MAG: hypothetical protein D6E12_10635 [Desulfovibrio sp.]|nr:MAG: hypothetical protein D6E12_10635 [Desulfovibrio sp.]
MPIPLFNRLITLSVVFFVLGVLAFLGARYTESELLLQLGILFIVLAAIGAALHTIRTREEPVSLGEEGTIIGYLTGTQAVLSGLSHLILGLAVLIVVVAWILGQGKPLMDWTKENSGVIALVPGVWLFTHSLSVIIGKALSSVGQIAQTKVDGAMIWLNVILEKAINVILCLVGLVLICVGCISLISGRGALEMVLGIL